MTCNACGEHYKKHCGCKDCTRAVLELTHPEKIVTLRKVVVPASMGDDTEFPPKIGKYCNVILYYEANKHVYLYSSDGIPTLLEMDVPKELLDKVKALEDKDVVLQGEIENEASERLETDIALREDIDSVAEDLEELKNSPDVVDIVATYADLQAYDTSALGDKDVIRVLADETHSGASAYYRWDKPNTTWTYIGITGPYYTKTETDTLIESAKKTWVGTETTSSSSGATAEITTTSGDFVWNEGHTVTVNFKYKADRSSLKIDSGNPYDIDNVRSFRGGIDSGVAIQYVCAVVGGQRMYRPIGRLRTSSDVAGPVFIANNLTSGNVGLTALSAYQGKVLKDMIDDNVGMARVLTADDYNWNSTSSSTTEPYDSIALWLLPSGQYQINGNSTKVFTSIAATELAYPNQHMYLINREPGANASILVTPYSAATPQTRFKFYVTYAGNGQPSGGTTANGMTIPWGEDMPTVVQTTGTSTTNVMSQKAVSDAINNIPEYVVELTADDYDFPESSPNSVAIWRLPDGIYYAPPAVEAVRDTYSPMVSSAFFIVSHDAVDGAASILAVLYNSIEYSYAAENGNPTINPSRLLNASSVHNGLNAVAAGMVLDARQGKVLKDMIDATSAVTPVITLTATDPGEGVALAANHFIGVYDA